jgi:hypothetical protein
MAYVKSGAAAFGNPFTKALIDAGIIPPECTRVVIDCQSDRAIKIHYEVFADQKLSSRIVLDGVRVLSEQISEEK